MINRIICYVDKVINALLTIFFILIILVGVYAIYDLYQVNTSAKLSDDIINLKPVQNSENSLKELKLLNEDIVAWIKLDGTTIDYPVVKGKDNNEYLDKNYKKDFSISGSIFLDYRNDSSFSDDYSIMYGHNMKSEMMFSDIKKYTNPEFFYENTAGILYTNSKIYKIEIISLAKVSAYENRVFNIISYGNNRNDEILDYFSKNSILKRNVPILEGDKLLLLSTCNENSPNEREVLLTKISKLSDDANLDVSFDKLEDSHDKVISKSESINKKSEKKSANVPIKNIILISLIKLVIVIFAVIIVQKYHCNN